MRDADQMTEGRSFQAIAWAFSILAIMAATFGGGFFLGRRVARQEKKPLAESLAGLDAERKAYEKLTFYQQLSSSRPGAEPASNKPTPSPALARDTNALDEASPRSPKVQTSDPLAHESIPGLLTGPAQPGDYTVQVSSFQTRQEAKAFAGSLERKGFRPYVVESSLPAKGTWYRVRVGRFTSESDARTAKSVLARSDLPAWILRLD